MTSPRLAERESGRVGSRIGLSPERARRVAPFLPAIPVLGLWLYLAPNSGGYFPRDWYPAALLAVALAIVVSVAAGRVLPAARQARIALLFLAAFVAWAVLSMLWADSTGSAWEAANKLLLVLALAWTMALLPWSARSTRWLLGAWSLGLAVFAVVSLVGASGTEQLSTYLFENRYQHPVGYANGNAALGFIGMLAAFGLSTDREAHPLLAGLSLAAAALLADFALLSQSRGSFVGIAVALPVLLLLAPDRLRVGMRLLMLAGAVALAIDPIVDVHDTGEEGGALGPALDDAVAAVWPSVVVAGIAGVLLGLAERAAWRRERLHAAGRRAGIAGAALIGVAALVLAAANLGPISDTVSEQWSTLTGAEYVSEPGARISNLDPYERPDYWRVAIDLFEGSPLVGVGAGSFEREYTARRREPKHSRYAHNLYLRALGEGGVVAAGLLLAFFVTLFGAAALLRRGLARPPALVLATCFALTAYFAVHLNFDWLEEIPAIASPALALPLVALVVAAGAAAGAPAASRGSRAASWVAGGLALVALVSLVPPYLSVRYSNRAEERAASDLAGAFSDLDRARSLNPAALDPDLAEGRIAIDARRYDRAREAFERSLTVEDNWLAHYELALLDAGAGRFEAAARELVLARSLNARDPVLTRLQRNIAARRRVDPKRENTRIQRAARARFTTSGR